MAEPNLVDYNLAEFIAEFKLAEFIIESEFMAESKLADIIIESKLAESILAESNWFPFFQFIISWLRPRFDHLLNLDFDFIMFQLAITSIQL